MEGVLFLFIFKILKRTKRKEKGVEREGKRGKRQLRPNDFTSAAENLSDVSAHYLQQFGLVSKSRNTQAAR